ncbi:uncharacterized protein LOC142342999 [Convolutriloba macropyga]|uniref:uncharacterized protein LOC142342999 n=1 Tax=Convolutriloba macropyga TaxID=536237 RepID=UPI003F522762
MLSMGLLFGLTSISGTIAPTVIATGVSTSEIKVEILGPDPNFLFENYILEYSADNITFYNFTPANKTNDVNELLGSPLESAAEYYFRGRLQQNGLWSDPSAVVPGCTFFSPTAPANFGVETCDNSAIMLVWDSVNKSTGYEVRSLNDGTWIHVSSDLTYNFTGLSSGRPYSFEARAFYTCPSISQNLYSNAASLTTFTAPKTPQITIVHAQVLPKKVTVTFDNYDSSVVGTVWRNGSEVISSVTSRSATDTAPDYSTYYSYSARYKYATGSSTCTFGSFSSEAFICTYPGNVQNIQANAVNSSWVMLSWDAPESGTVDGYQWYITENNKNNVTSNKNVNITSLSAASTHLLYVTTYYICPDGNVLEGLPQPITVYTAPQSVVLTAIGVSSSEIQLTVTTTNVITNLSISRDGSEIVWNLRSGDTYTDSGLSAGQSYSYNARSYNNDVEGDQSLVVIGCTLPSTPSSLAYVTSDTNTIDITFNITGGVTSAEALVIGESFDKADTTSSHQFDGLTASSTYSLVVRSRYLCPISTTGSRKRRQISGISLYSQSSEVLVASTVPNAPSIDLVVPYSTTEIQIQFSTLPQHSYSLSKNGETPFAVNSDTSYIYPNLTPGTEYTFSMFATRSGLRSVEGPAASGCTYQLAPDSINSYLLNATYANVVWTVPVNVGSMTNFILSSGSIFELNILQSSRSYQTSLTEMETETFTIFSQFDCPSSGTLNSSKISTTIQAGIIDFTINRAGRLSDNVVAFGVSKGNLDTTYAITSDNQGQLTSSTNFIDLPYNLDLGSCGVEDCIQFEAFLGTWSVISTNGPLCDCSVPCPVSDATVTVFHPDAVEVSISSVNTHPDVTYEYRTSANGAWVNIGTDAHFNITNLPPAEDVRIELRARLQCPSTSETLLSDSIEVRTSTGPSAGHITGMETVIVEGDPGWIKVTWSPPAGEASGDMTYDIMCRYRGYTDNSWSSWFKAASDLTGTEHALSGLAATSMYHCYLVTKLNGQSSPNTAGESFACTRPSKPTDMAWTGQSFDYISYEWDHVVPSSYQQGSMCFETWYENEPKLDNGVTRSKTFFSLPNPTSPYLMSARAYYTCAVDTSSWEPFKDCTRATAHAGLTYNSVSEVVYSDFTQIEAWTGPTAPSIASVSLEDCTSVRITVGSFRAQSGVTYVIKRFDKVIQSNPINFYVDRDGLVAGRGYEYKMTAIFEVTNGGITATSDSSVQFICTCPAVPFRIDWVSEDAHSVNMSWSDSVAQTFSLEGLFLSSFSYWYEIDYKYTHYRGGAPITSGFVNTTSLLGEAVTGLPGPSHALRVELLAVLDCDNFQGRVQSAGTTLASAVYTKPFEVAMNASESGCESETSIKTCISLNGNEDPSRIFFYQQQTNISDDLFHISFGSPDFCAIKTGLTPGTHYNFTATVQKNQLEGPKFDYFQLCTCPGGVENINVRGLSLTEVIVNWDAPSAGSVDSYLYARDDETSSLLNSSTTNFVHGKLTAGTEYTFNVTIQTEMVCQKSSGDVTLQGTPLRVEVTGCTLAAAPIITATYVSITQVRLTISQPVGKADYYILVSDPPMNDPQLAEIGSTLAEGKQIDASGVVNLLNLEEYRPYIFYLYPVLCGQVGHVHHRVFRVERPATATKFMNMDRGVAMFVLFSCGVGIGVAMFVALSVWGLIFFKVAPAAKVGAAANGPIAAGTMVEEIPANWRINHSYEIRADFNALLQQQKLK